MKYTEMLNLVKNKMELELKLLLKVYLKDYMDSMSINGEIFLTDVKVQEATLIHMEKHMEDLIWKKDMQVIWEIFNQMVKTQLMIMQINSWFYVENILQLEDQQLYMLVQMIQDKVVMMTVILLVTPELDLVVVLLEQVHLFDHQYDCGIVSCYLIQ